MRMTREKTYYPVSFSIFALIGFWMAFLHFELESFAEVPRMNRRAHFIGGIFAVRSYRTFPNVLWFQFDVSFC